jgi:pimeloyl-ACP methyl ester carboxylesterase
MGFEHLTVGVPGGKIFATRRGAGPAAILLHGGPGIGAEHLVGLVEELDGLINGVLPQQRGLGPSTLEGPRDIETHVADAIAVLDDLGWERAWLIGHAWGGHLAMHIAVAHPERVTGLILLETLGAIPDGGSAELVANMVARLTPDERAELDALVARQEAGDDDPNLMAKLYMTLWPSYSYIHGNVLPFQSLRLEVPLEGEPTTVDSVAAHFEARTLERGLPGLDLPALLIHGAGDPMPMSATTDTAALIPGARVEVVEEAGHFPWLERPGEVRRIVAAFLAEHPAPSIPDRLLDSDFIPEP